MAKDVENKRVKKKELRTKVRNLFKKMEDKLDRCEVKSNYVKEEIEIILGSLKVLR